MTHNLNAWKTYYFSWHISAARRLSTALLELRLQLRRNHFAARYAPYLGFAFSRIFFTFSLLIVNGIAPAGSGMVLTARISNEPRLVG